MVPAHYVSEELEQRESDVVWRLRYGPAGDWFYVYLLIEFQSSVLRFMAVRVLAYIMLLYEDLIQKKLLTSSGNLPPVVPIVLYNGLQEAKIMLAERAATWPKQWMAEGFQEGRTSGLLEGQRLALAELAREKFGGLEARFSGLIAEASGDQLRRWLKKILTAATPDDLFRGP